MNKIVKKVLSLVLSCCCVLSITACEGKECSHSYISETTKKATCKEAGLKTYTCSKCGDSHTEDIAKSTIHSYTSKVVQKATCKEAGVIIYTCSVCGNSLTEDIAKLTTHSYTSEVIKEATCTETGIKTYTCEVCGDSYTKDIGKNNNHIWQEATCTSPKMCTACNTTSGDIDAYMHSGKKICDNCGMNYYNVLANYIQTYGTYSNNRAIIKNSVYISGYSYKISMEYVFASGGIVLGVGSELSLSLSNDLSGEYKYMYLMMNLDANIIDSMNGILIAKDITSTTTNLPYTEIDSFQNNHTNAYIQANTCRYIKILLTALNTIFEDVGLGIGTKHLGFTNYPSNGD